MRLLLLLGTRPGALEPGAGGKGVEGRWHLWCGSVPPWALSESDPPPGRLGCHHLGMCPEGGRWLLWAALAL